MNLADFEHHKLSLLLKTVSLSEALPVLVAQNSPRVQTILDLFPETLVQLQSLIVRQRSQAQAEIRLLLTQQETAINIARSALKAQPPKTQTVDVAFVQLVKLSRKIITLCTAQDASATPVRSRSSR